MKKLIYTLPLVLLLNLPININAQTDADEMGAWYMYILSTRFKKTVFRDFKEIFSKKLNLIGDLQQLLIRGGLPIYPRKSLKLTLGYAYIGNGTGDSDDQTTENRFYQETSFPLKLGKEFIPIIVFDTCVLWKIRF